MVKIYSVLFILFASLSVFAQTDSIKAKSAEELLMESVQIDSNGAYATIRVLNGECRLEEVYVKGKPLKSFFQ